MKYIIVSVMSIVPVVAYERSVKRYLSTREELGEPDPFRMKYRTLLTEIIREVVFRSAGPDQDVVEAWAAERLPEADRSQFISLVEAELRGLHEGNIARFRLRPKEFAAWQGKKGI